MSRPLTNCCFVCLLWLFFVLRSTLLADEPGVSAAGEQIGSAWEDARNPVRVAFGDERLQLWSLRVPRAAAVRRSARRSQ